MSEIITLLTGLVGIIAIILKQIFSQRNLVKRLDNQDSDLAEIKQTVSNHLIHEIAGLSAKLDNLPCKVKCDV